MFSISFFSLIFVFYAQFVTSNLVAPLEETKKIETAHENNTTHSPGNSTVSGTTVALHLNVTVTAGTTVAPSATTTTHSSGITVPPANSTGVTVVGGTIGTSAINNTGGTTLISSVNTNTQSNGTIGTTSTPRGNQTVATTTVAPPGNTTSSGPTTVGTTTHAAVGTNQSSVITTTPGGTTTKSTVLGNPISLNVSVPFMNTTLPAGNSSINGQVIITGPISTNISTILSTGVTTTTVKPTITTVKLPSNTTRNPFCSTDEAVIVAGSCYIAFTSIAERMDAMTNGNLLDAKSIQKVNGYCSTFKTCFAALETCGDFNDTNAVNTVNDFCKFYHFFTSQSFLSCTTYMESVDARATPCMTRVSAALLDFNATIPSKCTRLMKDNSCAVNEVGTFCSPFATQRYQIFVNKHIQEWMC